MNTIIKNKSGNITSVNGFKKGDYIVFDRKLGGYSDCYFKIKKFFTLNGIDYVDYYDGMNTIDTFFSKGFRTPYKNEI